MTFRLAARTVVVGFVLLGFFGCELFSVREFSPKPEQLKPEQNAFGQNNFRRYSWTQGSFSVAANQSEIIGQDTLHVRKLGVDLNGRFRMDFSMQSSSSMPLGVGSALGFTSTNMTWDTAAIPDFGPDVGFPEQPSPGWRIETKVGELNLVRRFQGLDIVEGTKGSYETWVFEDSVFWEGEALSRTRYWLGSGGLVRGRTDWLSQNSGMPAGSRLWREVIAL